MKKLILLLIITASMQAQYKKAEYGKTNYKAGFVYYDSRGTKCTLIKWISLGIDYRWKTKFEQFGVSSYGWTDDCWLDVATKKAFINEQTHKIVYYDEVNIIPKT